jgi:hypothetical protein
MSGLKPTWGPQAYLNEHEHDRDLDQDTYDRGQGGTGRQAEEHGGGGYRDFEMV